jgi:acyl-CoA synthetase (AMP-forming)/AMP-acid ligase II
MLLDMAADGLGDRVAIGSRAGGLTYDGLRRAASAAAERLDGTGATSLVLTMANGPVLPVALFGAAWAGVSYAPVNFRLPDAVRNEMIERLQPAVVIDDDAPWLAGAESPEVRAFPDDPACPAVLLFTSGTSAAPKAAVLAHDQLLAYIFNPVEFAAAEEDEAVLLAVPPFHIAGVAAVLSSTYTGRRIVPLPRFDAEEWLVTARDEQVTHAFVVPTMLARIVAAMEANPELRVPTLRNLAYGGARTPATHVPQHRLRELLRTDRDEQHGRRPRARRPPRGARERRRVGAHPPLVRRPAGAGCRGGRHHRRRLRVRAGREGRGAHPRRAGVG